MEPGQDTEMQPSFPEIAQGMPYLHQQLQNREPQALTSKKVHF